MIYKSVLTKYLNKKSMLSSILKFYKKKKKTTNISESLVKVSCTILKGY